MSYISLSDQDKKEMMAVLGVSSLEELFETIPRVLRLDRSLRVPGPLSETELVALMRATGRKNSFPGHLSFLGAGAYPHFIPSVVDYLSSRGEFVSPYTPYQPEVSQGTLQVIFEFQTIICQLTGMDIANASLYEGASGAAEAVLMAQRITNRPRVLLGRTVHPQYREVIGTYVRNLDIRIDEIGYTRSGGLDLAELESKVDETTCAVVCQSPNFFGSIEDLKRAADIAHRRGALLIAVVAEALSLGLLEAPGRLGADIVTGEGQSFGIPIGFGGPYLGFMACAKNYIRQMPGRVAGQTVDAEGKRGFVLTLSTREQHIRRERATSNICTNQALCAVRATIFLEALGEEGLRKLAWMNVQKANFALDRLTSVRGVKRKFDGPVFNEFVLEFSRDWTVVEDSLRRKGIIAGLGLKAFYPELGQCAIVCVTENHQRKDIELLAKTIDEALR